MKIIIFLITFIVITGLTSANESIPCFMYGGTKENPTLKINKGSTNLYVDPTYVKQFMPERCNPPDIKNYPDSINMKYVKGIVLWGVTTNRIDESFFELRSGDSLDGIIVRNTDFDFDNLVENLIKYKIRLCSLSVDLKYSNSFPKNIGLIKSLSELEINFRGKDIELDTNIFHNKQLKVLKYMNRNIFDEEKFLLRNKGFKSLSLINCKKVNITKSLFEETSLEELRLTNCLVNKGLLKGINQFTNCRKLILEHCGIKNNQIDYCKFKKIEMLVLDYNNITEFPKCILNFKNLNWFTIYSNKINDLPLEIINNLPKANVRYKYLGISTYYLNKKVLEYFEENHKILFEKGYNFVLSDNNFKYRDYYGTPEYDEY